MTIDEVKRQLRDLLDDRRSFINGDAEHDEIYLKDIEAIAFAIRML